MAEQSKPGALKVVCVVMGILVDGGALFLLATERISVSTGIIVLVISSLVCFALIAVAKIKSAS
jgi:hypothetical protein